MEAAVAAAKQLRIALRMRQLDPAQMAIVVVVRGFHETDPNADLLVATRPLKLRGHQVVDADGIDGDRDGGPCAVSLAMHCLITAIREQLAQGTLPHMPAVES